MSLAFFHENYELDCFELVETTISQNKIDEKTTEGIVMDVIPFHGFHIYFFYFLNFREQSEVFTDSL